MKRFLMLLLVLPVLSLAQEADPNVCRSPSPSSVSVGGTAVTVAAAKSKRLKITICNSLENTGSPILKCAADGSTPALGASNAGDALNVGDCVTYQVPTAVKCIASASSTYAAILECN